MLRIIVRTQDSYAAAAGGGKTEASYKTFDLNFYDLERYLEEWTRPQDGYTHREVVGVEILADVLPAGPQEPK